MHRILISDKLGQAGLDILEASPVVDWELRPNLAPDALRAALPDYDAIIVRSGTTLDALAIERATRLKVIGRAGTGVDNIDLDAARQKGIVVVNTPGTNSVATAEMAVALMLAAMRHVPAAHASLAAGEWRRSDFVGRELFGKTLGIVGLGRVGRLVAERAAAFGMKLLAVSPSWTAERAAELGIRLVRLDALLAESDVVSLHAAVNDETRGMIDRARLAGAKRGMVLVNCARGGLLDESAVAEALDSGILSAAALDVYQTEPPDNSPLIGKPGVVHLPHLGASTLEAQANVGISVVERVLAVLDGRIPRDAVVGAPT